MNKGAFYIILLVGIFYAGCTNESARSLEYIRLQGRTMGTTYSISYASQGADYQRAIDSLLEEINMALSTYISESVISEFNQNGELKLSNPTGEDGLYSSVLLNHFIENFRVASVIHAMSDGAFDPTVGPLVNFWGFGWEGRVPEQPDSVRIDSLLTLVGMNTHIFGFTANGERILKSDTPGVKLDFSALAKGYGVDVLAEYLKARDVSDFFVEIGGEVRTAGVSPRGDQWRVGINQPDPDADVSELYTRVNISNKSMATSGNYRNYHDIDGIRVWHTINPKTGYPERNPLLSATIVHDKCIIADALATACMVMGPERGLAFIRDYAGAEAFILYQNDQDEISELMTPGFEQYLSKK